VHPAWLACSAGVLAALINDPVSWQECKDMGMESGRGSTSPDINGAAGQRAGSVTGLAVAALLAGIVLLH